jgi:hypothetical protein
MAVPRRLIVIAASALATGAVLYVRNRMKERAEREKAEGAKPSPGPSAAAPASSAAAPGQGSASDAPAGSLRELSQFLAGESWYDELGWQGIWEREGIDTPDGWLRSKGRDVLATERAKLVEHPALLAGCRRRWIVVCRYAGIDVADAASLWSATETAAA